MPAKDTRISLASGCVAGALEASTTWPMEYIKTQLQTFSKAPGGAAPPFTGIASGLSHTVRTQGFFALYTGLTPTLIFSVPKAGIRFGANQWWRNQLKDETGNIGVGASFAAGGMAGITEALFVVTPQETIKTKLINMNKGMTEGVPQIIKQDGLLGLWNGLGATCLKQAGNHGSRFMFMSEWKRFLHGSPEAKLSSMEAFAGGMGAGLFSIITTGPFDVVKTRMQSTQAKQCVGAALHLVIRRGLLMPAGAFPPIGTPRRSTASARSHSRRGRLSSIRARSPARPACCPARASSSCRRRSSTI